MISSIIRISMIATSIYTILLAVLWLGWKTRRRWRHIKGRMYYPPPMQAMPERYAEHTETVNHTSPEINGGCLLEVLGGAGHLPDMKAGVNNLGEHLVVKNKIV